MDQDVPDPMFSVSTEVAGDRVGVQVTGEVDMSTADRMYRAVLAGGESAAHLDLTGVTFFDSAAIHALIRIADHFPRDAFEVVPSPVVRRVLDIAGLGGLPWLKKNED